MYREIVVGTDGSPAALHALDHAIHLAAQETARLHIVTAYRPLTPDEIYEHQRGLSPRQTGGGRRGLRRPVDARAAADRADEAGVPSQVYARLGDPASVDPRRGRGGQRRSRRGRQSGHGGGQAVPAGRRPHQGLPPLSLPPADRAHVLGGRHWPRASSPSASEPPPKTGSTRPRHSSQLATGGTRRPMRAARV